MKDGNNNDKENTQYKQINDNLNKNIIQLISCYIKGFGT